MSQIKLTSLVLGLFLAMSFLALTGCGDTNSQVNFSSDSGTHPAGWLPTGHMTAAETQVANNTVNCTECHGEDLLGGISRVACTDCHLGNDRNVHPLQWGQFAYALHASFVNLQDPTAATCANVNCHGTNLAGVTGPSCFLCHLEKDPTKPFSAHFADWNTAADLSSPLPLHAQYVGSNGTASCRNAVCHGANLQGVFLSGPSCNACHSFTL